MEEERSPYEDMANQTGIINNANQGNLYANQSRQIQYQMEEAEKNLAEAQLDCEETLIKLRHNLKQDEKKFDETSGMFDWFPLEDSKKRVLTDEGVERIMQIMEFYINKETLLSNFDEKQINRRMLEFSLSLSALMFSKYEIYFRTPTLDECEDILKTMVDDKVKKKEIALRLQGRLIDSRKIREDVVNEFMERFEYEIQKIKEEKTKLNLREFEMIFTQLKALVESIHNRAWKGEERGSLRRHFNINEVIGGKPSVPERKSVFAWGSR